jgi:hypothetical protein
VITNTNGEVFRWNGSDWYLSGNGYSPAASVTFTSVANTTTTIQTVTFPRAGRVHITYVISDQNAGTTYKYSSMSLGGTLAFSYAGANTTALGVFGAHSASGYAVVAAGQVAQLNLTTGAAYSGVSEIQYSYI